MKKNIYYLLNISDSIILMCNNKTSKENKEIF